MKLRDRFVLTLFIIITILVAPAVYGLSALRELRQVAYNLSLRDAVGALALGRLQTAFGEVNNSERIYLALANSPGPDREQARARVMTAVGKVESELGRITSGGYSEASEPARLAWQHLRAAVAEEHRRVEAGQIDGADEYRARVVDSAFVAMDQSLDPIGTAINLVGRSQVQRAQDIASRAATTTFLALAIALAIALATGAWLARSMLHPVHRLQRAMSVVAEGDFEPDLGIPPERKDEIGDLARSFRWMAAQLKELERLRAEFVSVASHELKTPLSVVKGYISLLQEGIYGAIPPEQNKVLTSIDDQSDRLGRLVQELLDISRFEAGGARLHVQTLDVNAFLQDLTVSFDALAAQNDIDFRLETDPALPPTIKGDPDRLNEVVGNLLSNAFKFTPREGRIRLRARKGPREGDEGILIEVSDNGVGVPADKINRIFDKFYQVKNDAQPLSTGSGLGLAISREIVESHGGTITAESKVGRGTTFRVFLPTEPPHVEAA